MGGNVAPDDPTRNELIVANRLRASFPTNTHFEIFENRRVEDAHQKILQILAVEPGEAAPQQSKTKNQNTKIILYGHSWGASAVVTLADELQRDGIPVTLTIQVDSIRKKASRTPSSPPTSLAPSTSTNPTACSTAARKFAQPIPRKLKSSEIFASPTKKYPKNAALTPGTSANSSKPTSPSNAIPLSGLVSNH